MEDDYQRYLLDFIDRVKDTLADSQINLCYDQVIRSSEAEL